ncbi:MAG: PIN domain-containing protein [Actinomycetaceae bacterium]|nr:PIN domain-containing protein [Actinomycetaceae bacterium]
MYIVDTNVISELTKRTGNPVALAWLEANMDKAYLTCVTLYEMRYGIQRMSDGKRKATYLAQLSHIRETFSHRILDFGAFEAEIAGDLRAYAGVQGVNSTSKDIMIAAIATAHNGVIVTRNTKDFALFDVPLINPFDD